MIKVYEDAVYAETHGDDVDYSNALYKLGEFLIKDNPHYNSIDADIYCNCVEVYDEFNRNSDSCLVFTDGTYSFELVVDELLEEKLIKLGLNKN